MGHKDLTRVVMNSEGASTFEGSTTEMEAESSVGTTAAETTVNPRARRGRSVKRMLIVVGG